MNGNHSSDRHVEQFMRAVDKTTPYEDARVPSPRLIWLKAQWAEKREREQRVAQIRLWIEGTVQALVGIVALLTGLYYWPEIQTSLSNVTFAAVDPAMLYPALVAAGGIFTILVFLFGTRLMVRA